MTKTLALPFADGSFDVMLSSFGVMFAPNHARCAGARDHLERLFGAEASAIQVTPRDFVFRYRSPQHWVDVFRKWYGPVHNAFAALGADQQRQLEADLIDLINQFNTSGDQTMVVPAEYAEVVIVRR